MIHCQKKHRICPPIPAAPSKTTISSVKLVAVAGAYMIAPLRTCSGQKPNPAKPASMSKKDVIAFIRTFFDRVVEKVSKPTPAQMSKTYASDEGTMSGLGIADGLSHTTHHRASARTPARLAFYGSFVLQSPSRSSDV
jgi:hypothetical protein